MAKGSHSTRGGWEPRHCTICGQPVKVSGETGGPLRFDCNDLTHAVHAWHGECEQPGWPHLEQERT